MNYHEQLKFKCVCVFIDLIRSDLIYIFLMRMMVNCRLKSELNAQYAVLKIEVDNYLFSLHSKVLLKSVNFTRDQQ